jgi:signal transduction histidine kinase
MSTARQNTAAVPWLDRLAHDLRGPLSPVQTAIGMLLSSPVEPARQRELLQMIERQTRVLGRMIGEIGDWTRASQGTLLGTPVRFKAALLLDHALSAATPAADSGLQVSDGSGDAMLEADEFRLSQMLRILVDYAQTRSTTPRLEMCISDDRLRIDIRIPGDIDAEAWTTLLSQPASEPYDGGLGLNLLIARAIAEAHGGALTAEPAPGALLLRCMLPLSARIL